MPRRNDIESICIVGSGPIVIGQAAEFDYAGCQALKVLREDGFRTIVVNSNPATIMTDPGFADRTYIEPLDAESVAEVLRLERPDALLPTMGGQTALNLARELANAGVLDELGIELIGARLDAIERAEDRLKFKEAVESCGLKVPRSAIVTSLDELDGLMVPAVVRPAFTLGGHGGGFAYTEEELCRQVERGLSESPIGQVLVEESVRGWDEFELEVVRDRIDNVVIVCSIENLDPMGVHTGDSVTVAPQMTLPDEAYQELRDAAAAVIRAVGVDTGGSNIQFARSRETGDVRVIEMNPRVSRSSALASKATGYPIAKVAARLAVGYTLDEIPNDLTGTTPASFEPTLDYVVVKFPRFAFEKFPGADRTLGTQMKSVGETMGIGRTFAEAFLKSYRSRELDAGAATPWQLLEDMPDDVHPFFQRELAVIREALAGLGDVESLVAGDWLRLKRLGLSDAEIATAASTTETAVRQRRRDCGVRPAYRRVDSCAGEVEAASNYFYSTWGEADEAPPDRRAPARRHPRLRPEPDRAGDRVRLLLRPRRHDLPRARLRGGDGQLQPRDGLDRLRHVRPALLRAARHRVGARDLRAGEARRRRDPVRRPDAAQARARDRGCRLPDPGHAVRRGRSRGGPRALRRAAPRARAALAGVGDRGVARRGGRDRRADRLPGARPALVRPRRPRDARLLHARRGSRDAAFERILVDRFVEHAVEVDVDALCDGADTYVAAVMQHVEEAGVHSGDSACVLPAPSLSFAQSQEIARIVRILGRALGVVGLLNVQLAVTGDGDVYVIEANPRASRTVPFVSKATGVELVKAACRLALGATISELELPPERPPRQWSVKAAVLPFARFPGSDPVLGPEMRSTGEVMASAADLSTALDKAERAAGRRLPRSGSVFISIREPDHQQAVPIAATLVGLGFELYATEGTAATLAAAGIAVEPVRKLSEATDGEPTVVDLIRRGRCDLVINTPEGRNARSDGYAIREAALTRRVPCITTLSGAAAAVHAIAAARAEQAVSLQERIDAELGVSESA